MEQFSALFGRVSVVLRPLVFSALFAIHASAPASEIPTVDCVITPYLTVDVSSAVPGLIARVDVDRGDLVKSGQLVALLDSEVEQANVAIAEKKAAMESEVLLGEVNLKFVERSHQRLNSLYTRKAVSTQELNKVEQEAESSQLKLQHANDLLKLRQLELTKARAQLDQKSVRSPISGVVVQRFKTASEYVEDQAIVRIAQLDPLHVEAIVPMEMFGHIDVGMKADVIPELFSDEAQAATVIAVDRMGDAASGTFGVRLALPNPDNRLPAGLKCHAKFQGVVGKPSTAPASHKTDDDRKSPSDPHEISAGLTQR